MENNKLGSEPAFPCNHELHYNTNGYSRNDSDGMSKRLLIAKDVMCAILSNDPWLNNLTKISGSMEEFNKKVVSISYEFADELLKQENI